MPFKIVQTCENNKTRLFTVPSEWENKNVLKWPRARNHLSKHIRNEFSTPEADWKQMRCIVKRQNIPSYEIAEYVVSEMLNHTDTEDDTIKHHHNIPDKPEQELNLNIIADEIVYPANASPVAGPSEMIAETCIIPTEPPVGLDNDVYQVHILSDIQNNPNQHQCCANLEQSLAIQNALLSNQTQILEQLNSINKVQNTIIQKVALFSVQLEDAVLQMNQTVDRDSPVTELNNVRSTLSNTAFYVKPVDNIQQLNELEKQLSESSVRQKLKKKYSVVCSGGKGIDCAYTLADILFSRDFLCQCTWSGGSRGKDVKIAWKSYKYILSFFWDMVHSWDATYTINQNESFFKNILKNAKKRKMAKNQRASTSRKRAKLSRVQIANDDENSDEDIELADVINEKSPVTENNSIEKNQNIGVEEEKDIVEENTTDSNDSSSNEENDMDEENENIDKEMDKEQISNKKSAIFLEKYLKLNKSNSKEERAVKKIEKEENSLDEIYTDSKKEEHQTAVIEMEREQKDLEETKMTSKENTDTDEVENKENTVEEPKIKNKVNEPKTSFISNFKKGKINPKRKIVKISKKKREQNRFVKIKKNRLIQKNVSR